MDILEFLNSDSYNWVSFSGDFFTLSRKPGQLWMVHSQTNIFWPLRSYENFEAAKDDFLRLESLERKAIELHK